MAFAAAGLLNDIHAVRIDDKCAADELTIQLIALGHREITFITGPTGRHQAMTIAANAWPATGTVVHQPIQEMATTAVDVLLDAVTEPMPPAWREAAHPHSLVLRSSAVAP
ncbi:MULTISPECIES: hypothetical protein [Xanthomonas]|uniref:DNA-binding LacI/PurR family transcriptional regulator n=1 Tax=Xanthomonas cannabis TaxID=1885674 RepID=A0ABR6JKW0_9XANT|nr:MULTISPECIES: hypothetical protein [Xanthomonas]MBB4593450.1 DNA-binding LacI/PurR family transcriptional regulator [Xanthomonas cannabis]